MNNSVAVKSPSALRAAFSSTIAVSAVVLLIGISYGVYMKTAGFSFLYPMLMGALIYGASLEFLLVSMLLSSFAPLQTLIVAIMIQARHIFYGISMLDRFEKMGWKKPYLIFGMSDETFSINYSANVPENIDRGRFMSFVTLFNHCSWFTGATLGALFGSLLNLNLRIISFIMPAMFTIIFIEQWLKVDNHVPALIGFLAAIACLAFFGASSFVVPGMLCILFCLIAFRKLIESETLDEEGL